MKKNPSYLFSLLLHAGIVLILVLLFHCLRGVKEGIGYGTFAWECTLATIALAWLLIYTLRLAAQHRHPRVAESVLGLALIPLAIYFWLDSGAQTEQYNYVLPAQSVTAAEGAASSPTRIELSPEASISIRGYQESWNHPPILHLDIEEGDESRRAMLSIGSPLKIGDFHELSLSSFHVNDKIEPIAAELHYSPYHVVILQYSLIPILAALVLVATTYLCRVYIWGLGSSLILILSGAAFFISISEHGVDEMTYFENRNTNGEQKANWYPTLCECASSAYAIEIVEHGETAPLAYFDMNVTEKFQREEIMLAPGERGNATDSYLSYLSYEQRDGVQSITCRYAHWPFLNTAYLTLCMGLMMLAYTYYRVLVLRKYIAEKAIVAAEETAN